MRFRGSTALVCVTFLTMTAAAKGDDPCRSVEFYAKFADDWRNDLCPGGYISAVDCAEFERDYRKARTECSALRAQSSRSIPRANSATATVNPSGFDESLNVTADARHCVKFDRSNAKPTGQFPNWGRMYNVCSEAVFVGRSNTGTGDYFPEALGRAGTHDSSLVDYISPTSYSGWGACFSPYRPTRVAPDKFACKRMPNM